MATARSAFEPRASTACQREGGAAFAKGTAAVPTHDAARSAGAAIETLFVDIAATRMQGVPILHPGLRVQAVGFEAGPDGRVATGVLITPWFMNLVRLPLVDGTAMAAPGVSAVHAVGGERFAFIGADEPGFGAYEACSLFSPMFEFVDQAAALATAQAVLAALRCGDDADKPDRAAVQDPARRAWMLGRPRPEPVR